jgi:glucokinase
MSEPQRYIGLDVGGTSMKAGVVDDTGGVLSSVQLPTEAAKGQEHGLQQMVQAIRQAAAAAKLDLSQIAAIGVATPGMMDIPAGVILDPPNLRPWKNVPVRQAIAGAFGLPTAFQNDANAAALGEYWVGAGQGARCLVFFTLGTGIGGGIILEGKILEGAHSHGAELGHTCIEITNPRPCGCGRSGCLEAYASGSAVVRRAQEALRGYTGRSSLFRRRVLDPDLSARQIFEAALTHDEVAVRIVDETAYYLAVGATNVMHVIDPEMVVFGGGMVAAGEPFLDRIRYYIKQLALPVPAAKTHIAFAQLGSDAGFIGAAACARQLVHPDMGRRGGESFSTQKGARAAD